MKQIGIDLMGSDAGYSIFVDVLPKVIEANPNITFHIYGTQEAVDAFKDQERLVKHVCPEEIDMDDSPLTIRRKKDSSLNRMMIDLGKGELDGVFSAASTAGIILTAHSNVKLKEGIDRSFLIAGLPTKKDHPVYLGDMGANAECTADNLVQFAHEAYRFVKKLGVKNPRVGLLNIGSEEVKGDHMRKEVYQRLKEDNTLNFKGNCESRDLLSGEFDVVIADGFSGNVLLKSLEGSASFFVSLLKETMMSSFTSKLAALLLKKKLYGMKEKINYKNYGGACLLGFEKPIIKTHGSSDETSIRSTVNQLIQLVNSPESVI